MIKRFLGWLCGKYGFRPETREEMEERWALFLSGKIAKMDKEWGHRVVRTIFQPDSAEFEREVRMYGREERLPR